MSISTQKWILNKTFWIEIIVNRLINMTLPDAISLNEDNPKKVENIKLILLN